MERIAHDNFLDEGLEDRDDGPSVGGGFQGEAILLGDMLFGKSFDDRAGGEEALAEQDSALFVEDDGLDFFLADIEAAKWHTDCAPSHREGHQRESRPARHESLLYFIRVGRGRQIATHQRHFWKLKEPSTALLVDLGKLLVVNPQFRRRASPCRRDLQSGFLSFTNLNGHQSGSVLEFMFLATDDVANLELPAFVLGSSFDDFVQIPIDVHGLNRTPAVGPFVEKRQVNRQCAGHPVFRIQSDSRSPDLLRKLRSCRQQIPLRAGLMLLP